MCVLQWGTFQPKPIHHDGVYQLFRQPGVAKAFEYPICLQVKRKLNAVQVRILCVFNEQQVNLLTYIYIVLKRWLKKNTIYKMNTHISHCRQRTQVDENEQHKNEPFSTSSKCPWVLIAQRCNHRLESTKRTVQTKGDQHEEEDNRPEHRAAHHGNRLRIHNEYQAGSLQTHLVDGFLLDMRHVPGRIQKSK